MLTASWALLIAVTASANAEMLSVPISQQFDGNDGPWSTFEFRVGQAERRVRLLPSTYLPFSWMVSPEGCLKPDSLSDAAWSFKKTGSCEESRGGTFDCQFQGGCTRMGDYDATQFELIGKAANLSDIAVTEVIDRFSVGWPSASPSATIPKQALGLMYDQAFSWIGLLGLDHRPSNFSDQGGMLQPQPSFLENMFTQSSIGSVSYSYTAGAHYRDQDYGSLILGGMDQNRINSGNLDPDRWWTFSKDNEIPLRVIVSKITNSSETMTTDGSASMSGNINMPGNVSATIDSTRPYFYLPRSICDDIAKFLGGKYDKDYAHYLISDAQHALNLRRSLKLTLHIGGAAPEDRDVSDQFQQITLPYGALALNLTYPRYGSNNVSDKQWSTYIPILPAPNENLYVLGRALLQEAVITVDYGREKFFLAPQKSSSNQSLTAITCAGVTKCNTTTSSVLIAGIVSGVVGVVGILAAICFMKRSRRKRAIRAAEEAAAIAKAERMAVGPLDRAVYGMELEGITKQATAVHMYEIPSSTSPSTTRTAICEAHATPVEIDSGKDLDNAGHRSVIRVYYEMDASPPERYGSETQDSQVSTLSNSQYGTPGSGVSTVNSVSVPTGIPRLVDIPPTRLQPALTSQNPIYNQVQSDAVAINQTPPLPPLSGRNGERTPASPIPPTPLEFYGGFRRDGSHIPTPITEEPTEPELPKPTWVNRAPGVLPVVTFTPATPPTPQGGARRSGEWI